MANKIGPMIKEARTAAGLTQEQLAKKVDGVAAADISKAERGEAELTQAALKQIAKATGVTQASLLNAAKESTYKKPAAAKKTAATAAKKPAAKTTANQTSVKVTAAEKKLLEAYRAADSETKKAALKLLKGESDEADPADLLSSLLGGAVDMLTKKK